MEDKFCGTCGSTLVDGKCPNCDKVEEKPVEEKTVVEPVIKQEEPKKGGSSFGFGVLGFFFPLVGFILFLALKNKNKGASKGAGIGALIGFIIHIIIAVISCVVWFGLFKSVNKIKPEGLTITMKEYEKISIVEKDYDISEYHYEADWSDKIYDFYGLDKKIVSVLNNDGDVIFKIEAEQTATDDYDFYIILNNDKKVKAKDEILLIVGKFDFYYTDDVLIFNVGNYNDEVYFYDYKQETLVTAFNKDDLGNGGMYVTNIKLNDNKDLIFDTYVNPLDTSNATSGKSVLVLSYDNGAYKTLDDLKAALTKYHLDDFTLRQEYTHKKESNGYELNSTVVEKSIIEDFNENNGGVTPVVKECTGKITQGPNKHEYVLFSQQKEYPEYDGCTSVTFKLNDDFTIKYLYNDTDTQKKGVYINNKYYDSVAIHGTFYITGKTLVVYTMHQTSVNGGYSTTLINTNGEAYNFTPVQQGRDINNINTEGKRDDSFVVNENGELVITATRFNKDIDTDYLGDYAQKDITCKLTVDQVASAYNLTPDGDFVTEYTYKTTPNGLIEFNYTSKKTISTIRNEYKKMCE